MLFLKGIGKWLGFGIDQIVCCHIKDFVSFGWVQVVSEECKGMMNIYIVLSYILEAKLEALEEALVLTMTNVIEEAVIVA